jgi:hypothetical protein
MTTIKRPVVTIKVEVKPTTTVSAIKTAAELAEQLGENARVVRIKSVGVAT